MTTLILSESFKAFLMANRETLFSQYLLCGDNPDVTKCNYITLRKGEKITFHPRPENQQFNENGDWKREGRQEIKPKGLIRLLFGEEISNQIDNTEIEKLSNGIKNFSTEIQMQKVDPLTALSREFMNNWCRTSCMTGKQFAIDFYTENKDIFQFHQFMVNSEVIGRSIKVIHNDGYYFDRVYFKREEHESLILEFLLSEGHTCKEYQDYSSKQQFMRKNEFGIEKFFNNVYVTIDIDEIDEVPYMDTLTYYNGSKMTNNPDDKIYTFDSTDGEINVINPQRYCSDTRTYEDPDNTTYCDRGTYCGDYIYSDNAREVDGRIYHCDDVTYIDRYDDYVSNQNAVYSEHEGEDIAREEAVFSTILDTYLWADRAVFLDHEQDYVPEEQTVFSNYHNCDIYKETAIYINGDWIREENENEYLLTIESIQNELKAV